MVINMSKRRFPLPLQFEIEKKSLFFSLTLFHLIDCAPAIIMPFVYMLICIVRVETIAVSSNLC